MENNDKFKPTSTWMIEQYHRLNNELFNGELGDCILRPFTTGKGSQGGTLGWFKITRKGVKIERYGRRIYVEDFWGDRTYVNSSNFYDVCQPCIELNANYSWTEHAMLATLVHEMCHYYTYMKGYAPKRGHGPEFYSIGRIVSSRSNGLFTIQRLASAEQMNEMELDADMQSKQDKRLAKKKSKTNAVFVYGDNGSIEMSNTSSQDVIDDILQSATKEHRWNENERGKAIKIIKSNDVNLINKLFSLGYKRNFRTYRFWTITNKPWAKDIEQYDHEVLYDISNSSTPKTRESKSIEQPKQNSQGFLKQYFVLKLTNGGEFKIPVTSLPTMIEKIKERFPNFSDETITKLLNNETNFKMIQEHKVKSLKQIVTEALNEFVNKTKQSDDDAITIDPNQNLGLASPLENID